MSGCWLWVGPIGGNSGSFPIFMVKNRIVSARRHCYTTLVAHIDDNDLLAAHCGLGCCVNPQHARLSDRRGLARVRAQRWRDGNPERVRAQNKHHKAIRDSGRRSAQRAVLGEPIRCEICGGPFRGAHINGPQFDHNHDTNKGRGWLCSGCNTSIGCLGDNPAILRAAVEYLVKRGSAPRRPVIR